MKILLSAFSSLALLLSGCLSSHDRLHEPGATNLKLRSVAGTYSNVGSTPKGAPGPALIETLFPGDSSSNGADRVRLTVREKVVKCEAVIGEKVLAERIYREGREFEVRGSEVPLRSGISDLGSLHPQSVVAAVGTEGRSLRLSSQGDLVLKIRRSGAALVFMLVPAGMAEETDYIYKRLR